MTSKSTSFNSITIVGIFTVLVNVLILCATFRRMVMYQTASFYSYINKDTPMQVPVGPIPTVSTTFQESSRFSLSPDEDSNANWETLFTNQFGIGFQHLGPFHFRFVSGAYHALHCIYSMHEDFEKPNHVTEPSHHFGHCLMYLRQVFLCNADMTLEDGDFLRKNLTTDRIGENRTCRGWIHVSEWVNDEFRRWAEYNGVKDI